MLHQGGFTLRSIIPDAMLKEVGHLDRTVRNEPNQLLRALEVEGWPKFGLNTARTKKQYVCNSFIDCPCSLSNEYCKVASSNTSRLEAHEGFFRFAYKGYI